MRIFKRILNEGRKEMEGGGEYYMKWRILEVGSNFKIYTLLVAESMVSESHFFCFLFFLLCCNGAHIISL